MNFIFENAKIFTLAMATLIALTNIIVEVVKAIFPERTIHTNVIALVTAVTVTLIAGIGYANANQIILAWYEYVAMFVYGILVAYGAMFGYDKLKEIFDHIDTN